MKVNTCVLLIAGLAFAGAGSARLQAQEKDEEKGAVTGRIQKRTYDFKEAGKEMEYALYVPTGYDPKEKSLLALSIITR